MLKSLLVAGSVALTALVMAPGAEAKPNFSVYFGVPFYFYQVGPGWRDDEGPGESRAFRRH